MKQKKSLKNSYHDVVSRYCPYLGENVVMLKSAGEEPDEFECLNADHCEKKQTVACRMAPEENQDGTEG